MSKAAQLNLTQIARQRSSKLLMLAAKKMDENPALAKRYVKLARAIAMTHRFSLGNRAYCKKCLTPFVPGKTVKIKLDSKNKRVVYECLSCGEKKAFGYAKTPSAKRL